MVVLHPSKKSRTYRSILCSSVVPFRGDAPLFHFTRHLHPLTLHSLFLKNHSAPTFQCPQQPNLQIPFSRLYDGICDCCDGADEPLDMIPCPNMCDALLAESRATHARLQQSYQVGSAQRATHVAVYDQTVQTASAQGEQAVADEVSVEQNLQQIRDNVVRYKVQVLDERLARAKQTTVAVATTQMLPMKAIVPTEHSYRGLLEPLTDEELVWFIVHACQLAGEMNLASDATQKPVKTCIPLRLAGLDASVWWETGNNDYTLTRVGEGDSPEKRSMAELLDYNLRHGENDKRWNNPEKKLQSKKESEKHGRRLSEVYPDEDDEEDYMDDEYRSMNDDYMGGDYGDDEFGAFGNGDEDDNEALVKEEEEDDVDDAKDGETKKKREEMRTLIQSRSFSQSRVSFLERSTEVVGKIKKMLEIADADKIKEMSEASDNDTDDSEGGGEAENQEETVEPKAEVGEESPQVDPTLLPMIQGTLGKRGKLVDRGFDYAMSAKVLLDEVNVWRLGSPEGVRTILNQLAVGTLNHGQLSSVHVWQLLQAVVPELSNADASNSDAQTCQSPWAGLCPPTSVTRKNALINIPVDAILKAAESFCESELSAEPLADACAADSGDELPTDTSDGYYGYYQTYPRGTDDVLSHIFRDLSLEEDTAARAELYEAEKEVNKLDSDRKELEKKKKEAQELIDGKESNKFGVDGELYELRNTCHNVVEGKYVYEVCLFGGAHQRDKGKTQGGTGLGQWMGAEVEEGTGRRIWKWGNGAKCWNGPQRSATAYVTCGAETKILTADEPDTCRYALTAESPVACDENFRIQNNL
jgi:hypothetical protein